MGQVESAIFEDTPFWDLKSILKSTELSEEEINMYWKIWSTNPVTKKGKIDYEAFKDLFHIETDDDNEGLKLFNLLDFDDDDRIEFPELMLYLYASNEDLTREQKLKRSYNFYDNNGSGKISQEEMVEALVKLEKIHPENVEDKEGELVIPNDVLNLFALMDFEGDGKIKHQEFLKATMHYRRLGMLLIIDFLPAHRKALLQKMSSK